MPFEEVHAHSDAGGPPWLPGDGPPVVMLDEQPDLLETSVAPWQRLPVPRVLVPAVVAALILGAVVGALVTHAHDVGSGSVPLAAIQIRLDEEALAQGLDVYGLTRPALPLLITNHERGAVRVAQLTWASQGGRLTWYGDASSVGPGRSGRIWGESEITCARDRTQTPGLRAYVLLPGGSPRTVRIDESGSVAVFEETVQRACA